MAQCDAAGVNGSNRIHSHGTQHLRTMPNGRLGSPVLVLLRFWQRLPHGCRSDARGVLDLTCCLERGGREPRRRFATHPPASLVRDVRALHFLIRTPILKVCRSHLIAKNC
jgi:hypothetical protein